MKKTELLNSHISSAIARMGHSHLLTIVDCGYPLPEGERVIDMALKRGVPSFLETLDTVLEELAVEKVVIAEEMQEQNAELFAEIRQRFDEDVIEIVPHSEFKVRALSSKAFIRTGENVVYANIILVGGVHF